MNKKRLISSLIILGIIIVGSWLFLDVWQHSSTSDPKRTEEVHKTKAALPAAIITYTDEGFSPRNLEVRAGEPIRIINKSTRSLQFASNDHPTHARNPALNIAVIAPGKDATLQADQLGTWGYHNHLRATDSGTLTIIK